MKPIIKPIPKMGKKPVYWQNIDNFLKEHPLPYVRKTAEGFYDIFDGESHTYCGEEVALKYQRLLEQSVK